MPCVAAKCSLFGFPSQAQAEQRELHRNPYHGLRWNVDCLTAQDAPNSPYFTATATG